MANYGKSNFAINILANDGKSNFAIYLFQKVREE